MAISPIDPVELAKRHGIPPELAKYMPRYIKIESGGNPKAVTGSYTGVLQMGPDERKRYGDDSVESGVRMYADRYKWFQKEYGRAPDATELYLISQQGEGGIANHMRNPGEPAWRNMHTTGEGQQKGENWAKRAIWGNIPDDLKPQFGLTPGKGGLQKDIQSGALDRLTSAQFVDIWRNKVERTPIPPRPPGDVPIGNQLAGRAAPRPTTAQAFSPTPTTQQKAPMLQAPAQKAIASATTPKAQTAAASPVQQYAERPSTANPMPQGATGEGQFFRQRGGYGTELPVQQVLSNAPGMVPLPGERPGAAGPNAAQTAAIDQAYGRKAPAGQAPAQGGQAPSTAKTGSAPAQTAPASRRTAAAPPAGQTLGEQIIKSYGPRGENLRTYIDPNTGHQWITGSVDGQDMTRDIGPASSPARSAPAQKPAAAANPPAPAGKGRTTPTGPVPPAPEAAGRLAKPEEMAPPETTFKTLESMRGKPNTLTDLYKSGDLPAGQTQPGAPTFQDIANTPPLFYPKQDSTLTGVPVPPYNVPLPPERPGRGNLGTPEPGPGLMSQLKSLLPNYDPGFLDPGRPRATPAEQEAQDIALASERNRSPNAPPTQFAAPRAAPDEAGFQPPRSSGSEVNAGVLDVRAQPFANDPGISLQVGPQALSRLFDALVPKRDSAPSSAQAAPTLPTAPRSADLYGGPTQPAGFASMLGKAGMGGGLAGMLAGAVQNYSPGLLNQSQQIDEDILNRRVQAAQQPDQPVFQPWAQQEPMSGPAPTQSFDYQSAPFSFQQTPLPLLPDDLFANINWGGFGGGGGWGFSPG